MMCSLSYCTMYILGSVEIYIRFSYSTYWTRLQYILGSVAVHIGLGFSTYWAQVQYMMCLLSYCTIHIGLS